jgi:hypothetical protein
MAPILLTAPDNENYGIERASRAARLHVCEKARGSDDIHLESRAGVSLRGRDEGDSGQVHDGVGLRPI